MGQTFRLIGVSFVEPCEAAALGLPRIDAVAVAATS